MGVKGEVPLADIDDHVVARRHLDGGVRRKLARHLLGKAIGGADHRAVGDGIDLVAEIGIARQLILWAGVGHCLVVELHEIDGETLGDVDGAIDGKSCAAMVARRLATAAARRDHHRGSTDRQRIAGEDQRLRRFGRGVVVAAPLCTTGLRHFDIEAMPD